MSFPLYRIMKYGQIQLLRLLLILASGLVLTNCRDGVEIHVSPSGNDAADGSAARPFATLERARTAARAATGKGVTVWLDGGDYQFGRPFELTAADSGTASHPVIYRAENGRKPRLLGGRRLGAESFQPITDVATLARIPVAARGSVVALDLKALGVTHLKPYPDVFTDSGGIVSLYCDGKRMAISRFPNDGFMTFKSVIHTAGGPQGNWNDLTNVQKIPRGSAGGIFEYREEFHDRHALWKKQLHRGVWFRGYWRVAWENSALRVLDIDDTNRTATFAKPIQNGIGNKYTRPKGNGRESYQLINLLEEVDVPGEWALDFTDAKLYFYPPAALAGSEIFMVDEDKPVISINGASHVILRGLTVEANLGDGIRVTGGEGVLVAGCTILNVDRNGIVLDGGKNHTAQSNDLHHLGAGGIWLAGGDEVSRPRIPAGHRVLNNHIHHFGEIEPVYAAGVNCGFTGGGGGGHHPAVGMYVAHNVIHDTPHVGVLFGSMDSVFEYNEVSRYCLVSNDMGGFYSYDYKKRNFGNITFRHNFIHSSNLGDGIYFDHDHPDMKVIGNIVALGSTGTRGTGYLFKNGDMLKDGVTQPFDCVGNIAVDCKIGFEFVSVLPHQGRIEGNAAVDCRSPLSWREVKAGKNIATKDYATGKNMVYQKNPGFSDPEALDFRLGKDAVLLKDLPGFEQIPFERIGLQLDEYRTTLPTAAEIGRSGATANHGLGYDILDRK